MARISGKSTADELKGTGRGDDIFGLGGNDRLYGYGGNDELEGGSGNDRLYGGSGNDELDGGSGNDTLTGGAGNDELEGGLGRDLFIYGSGKDSIDDFTPGDDRIGLDKSLGIDSFAELMSKASIVDDGDDVLFDFGGGNTLRLEDTALNSLKAADFGFTGDGAPVAGPTDKDDELFGTSGHDRLYGQGGNDTLNGYAGNDDLEGGAGNDTLYGGRGNDDLEGGSGNDRLNGGAGRNELEGGSGSDTFVFMTGITEIEDFERGIDTVIIAKSLGVSTFDELLDIARVVDGGDDVRIDFGGAVLTFDDTSISHLQASDFSFV